MEMPSDSWRSRVRLASSDTDGVIPCSEDGAAKLGDHAEIAVIQL